MKTRIGKLFNQVIVICILMLPGFAKLEAQIELTHGEKLNKYRNKITYLVLPENDSDFAQDCYALIKSYWTFSTLELIEPSEIELHVNTENTFLEPIIEFESAQQSTTEYPFYYLALWASKNGKFKRGNIPRLGIFATVLAKIAMHANSNDKNDPKDFFLPTSRKKGDDFFYEQGLLKNFIQALMIFMEEGDDRSIRKEIWNTDELAKLSGQEIYIPEHVLITYNILKVNRNGKYSLEEFTEGYKGTYKLLSAEELDEKIMDSEDPFFYLMYIKSNGYKYVMVINSSTGEIIYSHWTIGSDNMTPVDFRKLNRFIKKKKKK